MVTDNIQLLQTANYGAPELKKRYQTFLSRGLIFAVIAHIIIIFVYIGILYLNARAEENVKKQQQQRIITLSDLEESPPISNEDTPPPKQINEVKSEKNIYENVIETVRKELSDPNINLEKPKEETKNEGTGDGEGPIVMKEETKVKEEVVKEKEKKEEKEVKKEIYKEFEVEQPPVCVNLSQVKASMKYPEIAREAGVSGKVVAKVIVGPDGNVLKVRIISGPEVFHSEVMDKAMNLQFTPGLQNGKPVKVEVTVPFNFQLKN